MKIKLPLPSKTNIYLGLYGLILYLLFMLSNIPAQQVWQYVPQADKARLQLGHIQGTIWSGEVDSLRVNRLALGQFDWDLNLLPLFIGQLALDAKINGSLGKLQSHLALSTDGRLQANDFSGTIPAESLNPYTLPAMLGGDISLNINKLIYMANQQLQIEGEAIWHKATISMLQTLEIGDVRIVSKAETEGSVINLSNKKSALGIEGTIKLNANGRYNVNLTLMNRDSTRKDIRSLLPMLGQVDAAGKVHIKRQGQLPLSF